MLLNGVSEWYLRVDSIVISTPYLFSEKHSSFGKVRHDFLHCAFGDPYRIRHVPKQHVRVAREAQEDMRVIGEEGPGR